MPAPGRALDVSTLTSDELEHTRRDLQVRIPAYGLLGLNSRGPDAPLACRGPYPSQGVTMAL